MGRGFKHGAGSNDLLNFSIFHRYIGVVKRIGGTIGSPGIFYDNIIHSHSFLSDVFGNNIITILIFKHTARILSDKCVIPNLNVIAEA
mgnify:CR=1 FL=1